MVASSSLRGHSLTGPGGKESGLCSAVRTLFTAPLYCFYPQTLSTAAINWKYEEKGPKKPHSFRSGRHTGVIPLSTSCCSSYLTLRQEILNSPTSCISILCRRPSRRLSASCQHFTPGPPLQTPSSPSTPVHSPKHRPALLSQASALFRLLCLFYLRFSHLLGLVCLSL